MKKMLFIFLAIFSNWIIAADNDYLFIQKSENATLRKNTNGRYTLILKNVPLHVSYFTDRPKRKTGILPLKKFLTAWTDPAIKNNYSRDPPNVAIAMITKSGKEETLIGTVSLPIFTKNSLTYSLKTLNKSSLETGDLAYVELFFDDIHWNPGGF